MFISISEPPELNKRKGRVSFAITSEGGGFCTWHEVCGYTVEGEHGADIELASWAQEIRPNGSLGVRASYKNHLPLCLPTPFI